LDISNMIEKNALIVLVMLNWKRVFILLFNLYLSIFLSKKIDATKYEIYIIQFFIQKN